MKPINVRKYSEILKLKRDNWSFGNFCIGFNNPREFFLHDQKSGEEPKQKFLIPARVLRHFIKKLSEENGK